MKKVLIDGEVLDLMSMPKVQEILAEFEGRISYLENSMPRASGNHLAERIEALERRPQITYTKDQWEFIEEELKRLSRPVLTNKQWDTFNQLSLKVDHLQGKVNGLFESRKTKGYTIK